MLRAATVVYQLSRQILNNNKTKVIFFSNMASNKLDEVPNVDIDTGRFKYILIRVYDQPNEANKKLIVRGYAWAGYHADIYDSVSEKLHLLGLECECIGGGRIKHSPDVKKIEVFGYSQGFGKADHSETVKLLKEKYADYTDIAITTEDY